MPGANADTGTQAEELRIANAERQDRVLKYRITSGCLIGAAFVLVVNYVPPVGAWLLLAILSCLAQLEFYNMANAGGVPVFRVIGLVSGTALISATFCTIGPDSGNIASAYRWEQFVLLGALIAVFVRQFPQKHNETPLATIGCTLLGIWYVPFLFNFITRLAFAWDGGGGAQVGRTGRLLVLYLVLVVKFTDIGAYIVGKLWGRHKLFPRISPGKTWEGLVGGIGASVLVSCIFFTLTDGRLGKVVMQPYHAVLLGVLLSVAGVMGDMFESLVKRATGVKDSSSVIPGMGGILDVLDSLLFGAPVLFVYAWMFLS